MTIYKHGRRSFLVLCSMTVVAADGVAANGNEEKPALEEVIVTAQLREQSLQDVPISIKALGAGEIAAKKIDDIGDIMYEVPGLSVYSFLPSQVNPSIRGAWSLNDAPGVDQSVAMFLDGVYIGQTGFFSFDLFDIERIEVLKGPQGTLFGRNVTGGALSVVTSNPPDAFDASFEGTVGDYGQREIQGIVGGPLSEALSGQIAFSWKESDGFYTNITDGKDVEARDRFGVRGKLRYDVNDAVELVLSAEFLRDKTQGSAFDLTGDPLPYMGTEAFGPNDKVTLDFLGGLDNETQAYTGTITVDTSIGTITSITAYRESDNQVAADPDGTDVVEFEAVDDDQIEQFSQELRLAGQANNIDYVGGLYFVNVEHERIQNRLFDGAPGSLFEIFLWPEPVLEVDGQDIETTSYAAYGEITYTFERGLSLTGGIRYTKDEKTGTSFCTSGGPFVLCPSPALTISHDGSWDAITPRFVAQYEFSDDFMAYGSYSRGFKSGGFPLNIFDPDPQAEFKPEYADNYEVGIKSRHWDQRLQMNLAIFRTEYTDLQVIEIDSSTGHTFAANAGEATTQGVELDLNVALTNALYVYGNYSYLDSEYKSLQLEGSDYSGNETPLTPEHSFNVGAEYTWDLPGDAGEVALRTNVLYKSRYFLSVDNDPNRTAKLDHIVNAGISYTTPGERWEFSLWGKNLTDERTFWITSDRGIFIQEAGDFFAGAQTYTVRYTDPRTWGATVRWNY
jgi:iron complex outermembrane receptor protein